MRKSFWHTFVAAGLALTAFGGIGAASGSAFAGDKERKAGKAAQNQVAKARTDRPTKPAKPDIRTPPEIRDGILDGSLSRTEVEHLLELHDRVRIMHRLMRADGVVTQWERQQMRAARAALKRAILRERQDTQYGVRPDRIEQRIRQAQARGKITDEEAREYRVTQVRIRRYTRKAASDGELTRQERARIWRSQFRLRAAVHYGGRLGRYVRGLGKAGFGRTVLKAYRSGAISAREVGLLRAMSYRFASIGKGGAAKFDGDFSSTNRRLARAARKSRWNAVAYRGMRRAGKSAGQYGRAVRRGGRGIRRMGRRRRF